MLALRKISLLNAWEQPRLYPVIWLILLSRLFAFDCVAAYAQHPPASDTVELASVEPADQKLWRRAQDALENKDIQTAAKLFKIIHGRHPDSARAEEALWNAANLEKQIASESEHPDWEETRDLFRTFVTDYPGSPNAAKAYFEVGNAFYQMRFFREALTYFKLFKERYPNSPLAPTARYWQAKTLLNVGRLNESKDIFLELTKTAGPDLQVEAAMGLGDIEFEDENYEQALEIYKKVLDKNPAFPFKNPEILRVMGISQLKTGKEKIGRTQIYHYLNLTELSPYRAEILFELAESYFREGDHVSAQALYGKVIEEGNAEEGVVVLSRFRQAQFLDDPGQKLSKWQSRSDLADPAGDGPYQAVLNARFQEQVEQEARLGLIRRYMARKEYQSAYDLGNLYLRYEGPNTSKNEIQDWLGQILVERVEKFLEKKQYQQVYELYRDEYPIVKNYTKGRLLYLVGQALESLNLYDQAAVIYYRAMRLPLSDEDKIDLYYHRARVYLAKKDLESAERLLKYLRDIYSGQRPEGEIYYLSGLLRETQSKYEDALAFYSRAAELLTFPDKKASYNDARLRMLFAMEKYTEAAEALKQAATEERLTAEELQGWYAKLGDILFKHNNLEQAAESYLAGLDVKMAPEGKTVQKIHLNLGDVYARMGDPTKSGFHYREACKGDDALMQKVAQERLNQSEIDQALSAFK